MEYTPKIPLGIDAKKLIIEALEYYIDRWGTKVDDKPLSEDAIIELNVICKDVNRYYKETTGYKKYKYPLIEKKSYNSEPEWDGHEEYNEIEGNNSFP